jgi:hypothetical protein
MNSDLRLTEKTSKFTDVLARCRVVGNMTARRDDNAAVARVVAAEQEFFAATLDIAKSSTRPAESAPASSTMPSTMP